MRKLLVFMDGFDSVRDAETESIEVFSTVLPKQLAEQVGRDKIPNEVIDNTIVIFNRDGMAKLDDYLLNEDLITTDEREIIIESIWKFQNN